jgi:hypothetical protein
MSNESIKEEDFLEVDREIPGQKYSCISFVSPEETLKNKEVYFVHKFLKTIAKKYDLDENTIEDKFKDFIYVNNDKLEKEFYENNDFRTTVRGVKVRGTYDTLREAQVRAKVLQKRDPNFNVYIGQVGYWLPWDPNPHKIDSQEYAEGELNTLVKKYKENQSKKDAHFQENIDYVKEQAAQKAVKQKEENRKDKAALTNTATEDSVTTEESVVNTNNFTEDDPWIKNKKKEKENDN